MFLTLHVCVFDSNDVTCNVLTITMRIDSTEKQKLQQVLMLNFFFYLCGCSPPFSHLKKPQF